MFHILKQSASAAARTPAFYRFVRMLENADARKPGLLRVLTYHRVDKPTRRPWLDPALISASPKDFEKQMSYLAHYCELVTVDDVLAALRSRNRAHIPPRAVLVTFDDGYRDFEEQAWPILKRYKIPAALFVPTAYPGSPELTFWWDDLYQAIVQTENRDVLETPVGSFSLATADTRKQAYQRMKNEMKRMKHADAISAVRTLRAGLGISGAQNSVMSWDSLRRLSREGLTIGAHTRTHPLLNRISLREAREEVIYSHDDLQRELGVAHPIFAYPGGALSADVVRMLEREGFSLAFTTRRGINNIVHMNPLKAHRINVGGRTSLPVLRAQLLSWTTHLSGLASRLDSST